MRTILTALLMTLATQVAAEETSSIYSSDKIRISSVEIYDLAKQGCWTNLTESRQYLEEQLRIGGYTLLDSPNGDWVTEADKVRAGRSVAKIANDISEADSHALFLRLIQGDVYEAFIRVNADLSTNNLCYGGIRIGLSRYIASHEVDSSKNIEFTYLDQIVLKSGNLNIPVLELSKQFVRYISTGSFEE